MWHVWELKNEITSCHGLLPTHGFQPHVDTRHRDDSLNDSLKIFNGGGVTTFTFLGRKEVPYPTFYEQPQQNLLYGEYLGCGHCDWLFTPGFYSIILSLLFWILVHPMWVVYTRAWNVLILMCPLERNIFHYHFKNWVYYC